MALASSERASNVILRRKRGARAGLCLSSLTWGGRLTFRQPLLTQGAHLGRSIDVATLGVPHTVTPQMHIGAARRNAPGRQRSSPWVFRQLSDPDDRASSSRHSTAIGTLGRDKVLMVRVEHQFPGRLLVFHSAHLSTLRFVEQCQDTASRFIEAVPE
jgi:hypothetical protein